MYRYISTALTVTITILLTWDLNFISSGDKSYKGARLGEPVKGRNIGPIVRIPFYTYISLSLLHVMLPDHH